MRIDKGKAIFIVESPLQLICAFEAVEFSGYKEYHVVVRLSGKDISDRQIKKVASLYGDKNISYIFFKNGFKSFLLNVVSLFKVLINLIGKKNVYIGNAESNFLKLVVRFCVQPVNLLDDGTKTLYFAESRIYQNNCFFTMFDLKDSKVKYIKHDFLKLKSIVFNNNTSKESGNNFFLGSDISEIGLITEVNYIEMVRKVTENHQGLWVYVAHRNESQDKLELISKKMSMEIKRLQYPVEFIGYECGIIPKLVCSFYSTALISLNEIYQIDVLSYRLDESFVMNKNIEHVYNQCSKYIPVVDI